MAELRISTDFTDVDLDVVHGFLSRDARVTERKKAGLKKARKASQFSKR